MIDIRLSGMFLAPSSCPPPRTLPSPTAALPSSLKVLSSLNVTEVGQSIHNFMLVSQHYGCALPLLLLVAVGYSQGFILFHLSIYHNLFYQSICNLRARRGGRLETTQMPFKCNGHRICTCSTSEATDNHSVLLFLLLLLFFFSPSSSSL